MYSYIHSAPSKRRFLKARAMRCLLALVLSLPLAAADGRVSVEQFEKVALPALPIEEPHDFRRVLEEDFQRPRRDPAAKLASNELDLSTGEWSIVLSTGAGPVLRQAAEEFRSYLNTGMGVQIPLAARQKRNVILLGTRDQIPGCSEDLKRRKDYQLRVSAERVVVCGYDERGAMFGVYNLESRMDLRGAPFLPGNLNTVRHSLQDVRMTLSGLGWMEWPDWYLRMLPRYGFDAIYASVYANPDGARAPEPYGSMIRLQDPAKMRDLIQRAARYGLDVYAPIMYQVRGGAAADEELRKLVRDNATKFPEIRGYVLLIEGFSYEKWPSWNRTRDDMHNWIKHWAHGVAVAADEFHKVNPAIEVLPWDYNIEFRPEGEDLKRFVIQQYNSGVIPLVTWENGKSFMRDGERGYLNDYAINEVGPAEVAAAQIEEARKRGLKVYAKADTFASWQYGTFPYLPFPYQWYARYQGLEKARIDGTMETWSYGFKPNIMAEMRAWYSWSDAPPLDGLLRNIARREFGAGSEDGVLAAWKHFSDAIRLVPDTGPNMGTTNSIGSPLFFEKPQPRAMMVEHSWSIPGIQGGGVGISYYWPYAPKRVILEPDFSNKVNAAERYAKPFSLPVFNKYLLLAADEMEKGLQSYRRAALSAPAAKRRSALREVLLAEQIQRMMRSDEAVLEFEDLRYGLSKTENRAEQGRMLDRMTTILREEITRTKSSYETAHRDSRLGYEWEQDYFYTPYVLEEKLKQLRGVLEQEIPAYRRRKAIP